MISSFKSCCAKQYRELAALYKRELTAPARVRTSRAWERDRKGRLSRALLSYVSLTSAPSTLLGALSTVNVVREVTARTAGELTELWKACLKSSVNEGAFLAVMSKRMRDMVAEVDRAAGRSGSVRGRVAGPPSRVVSAGVAKLKIGVAGSDPVRTRRPPSKSPCLYDGGGTQSVGCSARVVGAKSRNSSRR